MITSTTVTAALYQLRPIDFLGICLISPKVLRGFRPCHEETLRSNLQWLVFSILKWMDGWVHANLQRERIRRLHPPIPQNPTRPTRTSKHTCRLEPFTSYRRLPHIMRLSSFHQTQATSSCGAQSSPSLRQLQRNRPTVAPTGHPCQRWSLLLLPLPLETVAAAAAAGARSSLGLPFSQIRRVPQDQVVVQDSRVHPRFKRNATRVGGRQALARVPVRPSVSRG